jgi:hypothetical protein
VRLSFEGCTPHCGSFPESASLAQCFVLRYDYRLAGVAVDYLDAAVSLLAPSGVINRVISSIIFVFPEHDVSLLVVSFKLVLDDEPADESRLYLGEFPCNLFVDWNVAATTGGSYFDYKVILYLVEEFLINELAEARHQVYRRVVDYREQFHFFHFSFPFLLFFGLFSLSISSSGLCRQIAGIPQVGDKIAATS